MAASNSANFASAAASGRRSAPRDATTLNRRDIRRRRLLFGGFQMGRDFSHPQLPQGRRASDHGSSLLGP